MAARRPLIVCFPSYYLPGVKSGGPLRSLLHMQEALRDEYEFMIITRDRDLGDAKPYTDVRSGRWSTAGRAGVWYLQSPHWMPRGILSALRGLRPDLLYFQSGFDPSLTVVPLTLRRLNRIPREWPVLVAPRGELSPGARSLKRTKKAAYLPLARLMRLYEGVAWHATSQQEADEIRRIWGGAARVRIAPNIPSKGPAFDAIQRRTKSSGLLRLVFLSRISRMKNLHGALSILRGVSCPVEFDIYGSCEDPGYWRECRELIEGLPGNIRAEYRGSVLPQDVIATLAGYDVFLLPTLGENFGHVISEALLAGCPVLLSDRTPWRDLAASRAGFDIALDDVARFGKAIEDFAGMDAIEFGSWSRSAREYGVRHADDARPIELTRQMLVDAMRL